MVVTITFGLLRLLPGGPFVNPRVPPEVHARLVAQYGLDQPVWRQYLTYIKELGHGNLGTSYSRRGRAVSAMVLPAMGVSLRLGMLALIVGSLLGIGLACLPLRFAWQPAYQRWIEPLGTGTGLVVLSTPLFVAGGGLILLFSFWLGWLPGATLQSWRHWILPVMTLSLMPAAYAFWLVRQAIDEVRVMGYVSVKRALGLGWWPLIALKHVLRNALMSWMALLGPIAASLLTGSFAVEVLFAIPGLGNLFVAAVNNRDYPVVMAITLLYAVVLVMANALTDLALRWLDPRLREAQ